MRVRACVRARARVCTQRERRRLKLRGAASHGVAGAGRPDLWGAQAPGCAASAHRWAPSSLASRSEAFSPDHPSLGSSWFGAGGQGSRGSHHHLGSGRAARQPGRHVPTRSSCRVSAHLWAPARTPGSVLTAPFGTPHPSYRQSAWVWFSKCGQNLRSCLPLSLPPSASASSARSASRG